MVQRLVVLSMCVLLVWTIDVSKIARRPLAIQPFDLNKILGQWYISYFVNPRELTNSPNVITSSHVVTMLIQLDPAIIGGDVLTGKGIVVATDYKTFLISWGCTRESTEIGFCLDPWLSLKTRKPISSKRTLYIMKRIIHKIWGITPNDLVKVPQTGVCEEDVHRY